MDGNSNGLKRVFVLNPITPMTSGGGFSLAKGQVGVFSQKGATLDGPRAVSSISSTKGEKFFVEVGTGIKGNQGGLTTKNKRTSLFAPKDITGIIVEEAKAATTPKVILGYDGFDATKSMNLTLEAASNISITLSGQAVGYYGLNKAQTTQNFTLIGNDSPCPAAADCDENVSPCKDIVLDVVEQIKSRRLRYGLTMGDLMEVKPIFSCFTNPAATSTAIFYSLTINDLGDSDALAMVAGQYPGFEVVRESRNGLVSVYQIYKKDGSGLPAAFSEYAANLKTNCGAACPAGYTASAGGFMYSIAFEDDGNTITKEQFAAVIFPTLSASVGSVEAFTEVSVGGNPVSTNYTGVTGTASAAGTGGTFAVAVDAAGVATATQESGVTSGYVVGETILIAAASIGGGGDLTLTITALSAVISSLTKVGQDYGVGKYSMVMVAELTLADIAAIALSLTTKLDSDFVMVDDVCVKTTPVTHAWVVGESCNVTEEQYFLDLQDTECAVTRLAELQAAYPQLTIVEEASPAPAACRRRYSTMVLSSAVCTACNLDYYTTVAPDGYAFEEWTKPEVANTDADCLCGIEFAPKVFKLCQEKYFADQQASVNGQLEINVSGGADYGGTLIGYNKNTKGEWAVTRIGRAFDGTGWGEDLISLERISNHRETANFSGGSYVEDMYKGIETSLSPCLQYDTITINARKINLDSWVSGQTGGEYSYTFIVEQGSLSLYTSFFNLLTSGNVEIESI